MLSPLILFTFSGNILPAYVLPGVPAIGLLISILVSDVEEDKKWFKVTAGIVPILLIGAVIFIHVGTGEKKSDKVLFRHADPEVMTYYVGHRPFSGQFYSAGQAKRLEDESLLDNLEQVQLIGRKSEVEILVQERQMNCVVEYSGQNRRALYRCDSGS
jgi:4-amino-4-deoxy-L-arabinose transferase-like glycosyltransferase